MIFWMRYSIKLFNRILNKYLQIKKNKHDLKMQLITMNKVHYLFYFPLIYKEISVILLALVSKHLNKY